MKKRVDFIDMQRKKKKKKKINERSSNRSQSKFCIDVGHTVRCPLRISGAIQPSVPVIPDRREKLAFPKFNFLHSPKSDIMTRILR